MHIQGFPSEPLTILFCLFLQIVHRTLAAMLGSLAALAALAFIGDVRLLFFCFSLIMTPLFIASYELWRLIN